jgi:hypothetical protein
VGAYDVKKSVVVTIGVEPQVELLHEGRFVDKREAS